MRKEDSLQMAVCNYIRYQYPGVLFNSDMSGLNLTIGQAIRAKKMRSESGFPDIVIYERKGCYSGLFMELKTDSPFLKDGITLSKNDHLQQQQSIMDKLKKQGFYARFVIGFDDAKKCIDAYMEL